MAKYAYCKVCDKEVTKPIRMPMETFQKVIWVILSIASIGIGAIIFAIIYAKKKKVHCPTCRTKVQFSSEPHVKAKEEEEPLTARERVLKKAGKVKEKKERVEKETPTREEEEDKDQTFCPYCGEDIEAGIGRCPYCHSSLKTSY
ncbi:MAG: hypothetical protein ACFE96_00570 [Candidatus Hermodarchaeota archaeon]